MGKKELNEQGNKGEVLACCPDVDGLRVGFQ